MGESIKKESKEKRRAEKERKEKRGKREIERSKNTTESQET